MKKINANEIGACISEALDDGKKTIEAEEDPFAGAPGLDSTLEWSVEAYYLVLSSKFMCLPICVNLLSCTGKHILKM